MRSSFRRTLDTDAPHFWDSYICPHSDLSTSNGSGLLFSCLAFAVSYRDL